MSSIPTPTSTPHLSPPAPQPLNEGEEPAVTLERVTLLVEETGERVTALLNPYSVELRRRSGVAALRNHPGTVADRKSVV